MSLKFSLGTALLACMAAPLQASLSTCVPPKYSVAPNWNECLDCPTGKYSPGNDLECMYCINDIKYSEYFTSNGGVSSMGCNFATCINAKEYQFYSFKDSFLKTSSASCAVTNCTNTMPGYYYSGAGGQSAPYYSFDWLGCPISPCTNTPLNGFYWSYPGSVDVSLLTTPDSCPVSRCTNTLLNNQYYSSSGSAGLCQVSTCVNKLPIDSYWSANGFNSPTGCQTALCTNKPGNSSYKPPPNTAPGEVAPLFNMDENCAWTCIPGFFRDLNSCRPCPAGQFSTQSTNEMCVSCVAGVHYPAENAVLFLKDGQSACNWACNIGFSRIGSLSCVSSVLSSTNALTIQKFVLVLDLVTTPAVGTRIVKINVRDGTLLSLTTLSFQITTGVLHPTGKYAIVTDVTKSGSLFSLQLSSPFSITKLGGSDSSPGIVDGSLSGAARFATKEIAIPYSGEFAVIIDSSAGTYAIRKVVFSTQTVQTLLSSYDTYSSLSVSYDGSFAAFSIFYTLYTINLATATVTNRAGDRQGKVDGSGTSASFYFIQSTTISLDGRFVYVVHTSNEAINSYTHGMLRRVDLAASPAAVITLISSDLRLGTSKLTTSFLPSRIWATSKLAYSVSEIVVYDNGTATYAIVQGNTGQGNVDDADPGSAYTGKLWDPFAVSAWYCNRRGYDCNTDQYYAIPCQVGQSSDGMGLCTPCPVGSVAPNIASENCELCPAGEFAELNGSVSCTPCASVCDAGLYVQFCGGSSRGACMQCPRNCPVDKFRSSCGQDSIGICAPCQNTPMPNEYYYEGYSECSVAPCNISLQQGNYWSYHGGTRADNCSQSLCQNKPNNSKYTTKNNLNAVCAFQCDRGYTGQSCTPCLPGQFFFNDQCVLCQRGKFSTSMAALECQDCPAGYTSAIQGATQCLPCQPGTAASFVSSSACTSCPPGYVSRIASPSCTECKPGYAALPENVSQCSTCSAGTYSRFAAATHCAACTLGFVSQEQGMSECTPCPPGFIGEEGNFTHCQPCRPGSASALYHATFCSSCPPGSFSSLQAATACSLCDVDTIAPEISSQSCRPCTSGSFAPQRGSTSCGLCPDGFYVLEMENSSSFQCFKCPAGYVSVQGSFNCTPCLAGYAAFPESASACKRCPQGYVSQDLATACTACARGFFATEADLGTCRICPAGSYAFWPGSTACAQCFPGYVAQQGSSACAPCQPGAYQSAHVSNASCQLCPQGLYSYMATTACLACQAGYFAPSTVGPCVACRPGTFLAGAGQSACTACSPGTFSNFSGATACSACAPPPPNASFVGSACDYACAQGTILVDGACTALDPAKRYVSFTAVIARPSAPQALLLALRQAVARALGVALARVFAALARPTIPSARRLLDDEEYQDTTIYFVVEADGDEQVLSMQSHVLSSDFQADLNDSSKRLGLPAIVVAVPAPPAPAPAPAPPSAPPPPPIFVADPAPAKKSSAGRLLPCLFAYVGTLAIKGVTL